MKSKIAVLTAIATLVLFSSCYQVFTASAFEWAKPDITKLPPEQKVSYAKDLLTNGTTEQKAQAFKEINDLLPDDVSSSTSLTAEQKEMVLLAADLAIGSSNIGGAVSEALSAISTAGTGDAASMTETAEAIFESIDSENLDDAVSLIKAAENNDVALTTEQYANAAAAQLFVVVEDLGGVNNLGNIATLDPNDPDDQQTLANVQQAATWAEAGGVDLSTLGFTLPTT